MSTIFRQKQFSEYDAMIQLYQELKKLRADRNIGIINTSQLISTLRGNNIVIEKFTQATRVFGRDRYRMYIKIGARAKLPDAVRLPQYSEKRYLGNLNLGLNFGFQANNNYQNPQGQGQNNSNNQGSQGGTQNSQSSTTPPINTQPPTNGNSKKGKGKKFSEIFRSGGGLEQREFDNNKNKKKNNNNGGGKNFLNVEFKPNIDFLNYEVHRLLGEAIEYNKAERSLVLEFQTIGDAIRALNILPFGLGYNIYLLNA